MKYNSMQIELAREMDAQDELAHFRGQFVNNDPNLIYMDGNSLGRLPKKSLDLMDTVIEKQWGERLIRGWNEGWIDAPQKLGAKIAKLIGAHEDEVLVCDSTSVNLFKLAVAALQMRPKRRVIISDEMNFPSDLYILQGIVDLLGNCHSLELILSNDGVSITAESLENSIDENTALVALTHVAFKSAFMYDMNLVTDMAHRSGAVMLWDLSHSVGSVPLDLNACDVDLAVGCTYKYLNSGPGAPAFLFVRRDLQKQLLSPIWGWFSSKDPFSFELGFSPAEDISRFKSGTPPVLSLKAIEPALDLILEANVDRLRAKSLRQSEYLIYLADEWLAPLGFKMGSPRAPEIRGSHVSLRHAEAYRINRAMIESPPPALRVIPDFRAPDNIRLGIAPIYTSFTEINLGLQRMQTIVQDEIYKQYSVEKLAVT